MFKQSIVHQLVCPGGFLQDVQLPLRQHYENVWPGTPATLLLTEGPDGSADQVEVSWRQGGGLCADVMIIHEAQEAFMEPELAAA